MTRVMIVDDERHARSELRILFAAHPEVEIVNETDRLDVARTAFAAPRPDVILLDIALGAHSGFELLHNLPSGARCRCLASVKDIKFDR